MRFLTSIGFSSTSKPATVAVPSVGGKKHVRMRIVVVFPAPFGPRKPTIWPFWTSNEMLLTAIFRAYLLVRHVTVIIAVYSSRKMYNRKPFRARRRPGENGRKGAS